MFPWRLLRAVCALTACARLALAYEDDIEVNYSDNYFNEIPEEDKAEPTPSPAPCPSRDLNKWDKIFSMLENSQMRENMLLQYADDIIKVEMGSLRGEMLSFVAQYGGSCGVAVESAGRRMASQLESQLREALAHLTPGDVSHGGRPGVGDGSHGGRPGVGDASHGGRPGVGDGSHGGRPGVGDVSHADVSHGGRPGVGDVSHADVSHGGRPGVGDVSHADVSHVGRPGVGDVSHADVSHGGRPSSLEAALQQLLSAAQTQTSRLSKLEASCFTGPGAAMGLTTKTGFEPPERGAAGHQEQEVYAHTSTGHQEQEVYAHTTTGHQEQEVHAHTTAGDGVLAALQQARTGLDEALMSLRQRHLPAGCDMALLFPMRSRRIYAAVIPDVPLSTAAFTVCMWAKPTAVANKTVLFSYGNRRNPYEIQLLLSQTSAFFTIGGEAHLVEAQGVVSPGAWLHLCGAWSSGQGLASLWAGGKKAASTAGVAEGHVLPDGGSLQLGQERNGCCPVSPSGGGGGVPGFESGFDAKLAFAGRMTGVNMWDRVLSEGEIARLASPEGRGCEQRGNMVAWGVTEMLPHGGAQFVN